MNKIKKFIIISGISMGIILPQSRAYGQKINDYESYKLYCSNAAYAYQLQSSECDRYRAIYQPRLVREESHKKTINELKFKTIQLDDWRKPDPKLPWSEPIIVSSDFGNYYAVFDKNYKKSGDGFFVRSSEIGIISRWTTEELSIFSYQKLRCDAILGCRDQTIIPIGDSVEVLVEESVFKIYGENGNFPIPGNLMNVLQKADKNTVIKLRINGSLINDIGQKTVESLAALYSLDNESEKYETLMTETISSVEPLPEGSNVQQIVSYTTPGIVKIETNSGSGTGFIIGKNGLILTNRHVVQGNKNVTVTLYDGSKQEAEVIKRDRLADIAILKINANSSAFYSLPLCYAQYPSVGEEVIAIGNPLSLNMTVTRGIVSGIRQTENQSLIQTDAPINPGNSGGPLLNQYGEVIGIVNAKQSGMGIEGLGFAVSIIEALNNLGIKVEIPQNRQLNHCGNPITISSTN